MILSFDEDDIQAFVALGLTVSQSKIYLTLISLKTANAKKIAQTAKIDNAEAYRQLEILQNKALIEKIPSFPNEYKPLPLKDALKILFEQKKRENLEITKKVNGLLKKNFQKITHEENEKPFLIKPMDNYTAINSANNIKKVQKEMCWYTQIENFPPVLNKYSEVWKKNASSKARIRAIAEFAKPNDSALEFIRNYSKLNPFFLYRLASSVFLITFTIYDDKRLIIFTDVVKGTTGKEALCTSNPMVIKVFKEFFESKWKAGMTEYPKKEQMFNVQ